MRILGKDSLLCSKSVMVVIIYAIMNILLGCKRKKNSSYESVVSSATAGTDDGSGHGGGTYSSNNIKDNNNIGSSENSKNLKSRSSSELIPQVTKSEKRQISNQQKMKQMLDESKKYYTQKNIPIEDEKIDSYLGSHPSNMTIQEVANLATHQSYNPRTKKIQDRPSTKTLNRLIKDHGINPNSIINPQNADNVFHIGVKEHNAAFMNNIIHFQDHKETRQITKENALINKKNIKGEAPIHIASQLSQKNQQTKLLNNREVRLRQLLNTKHIDVNVKDNHGNTAFSNILSSVSKTSVVHLDDPVYNVLRRSDLDITSKNRVGNNYLHFAAIDNVICKPLLRDIIQKAHKANFKILDDQNNDGLTPLHMSLKEGNVGMADMIINMHTKGSSYPNLNVQDNSGRTALHYSICYDSGHMNKILTIRAINPNLQTKETGSTALHFAVKRAILSFDLKVVPNLLDQCNSCNKDININLKDKTAERNTPLNYCIILGNENKSKEKFKNNNVKGDLIINEICKSLIKSGADINAKNENGDFPMSLAIKTLNKDLVRILLNNKNINLDQKTPHGQSIYELALKTDTSIYKLLTNNK